MQIVPVKVGVQTLELGVLVVFKYFLLVRLKELSAQI